VFALSFQLYFNCICADIQVGDSITAYGCCFNSSRSTFTLHLRRKYLYHVIHLIVPYCLFSLIAVFTFVLQPSRTERLSLGMAPNVKPLTKYYSVYQLF